MTVNSNEYKRCVDTDGEHYVHEDAFKKVLAENKTLQNFKDTHEEQCLEHKQFKVRSLEIVQQLKEDNNTLQISLNNAKTCFKQKDEQISTLNQALQSEAQEVNKLREKLRNAESDKRFHYDLSEKRKEEIKAQNEHIMFLENQMRTLKQCLKDVL